ncbi:MAG: hypothetical protein K8R92_08975 [Planctomycetes bacterium]|nr:hypothetical protein [Planctomycetota bacterium]
MNKLNFSVVGLAIACAAGAVQADFISSDPYALGGNRPYHQTGAAMRFQVSDSYLPGGFFDIFVDWDFDGPRHDAPPPGTVSFGESRGHVTVLKSHNGLPPGEPVFGQMECSFFDVFTEISADGSTRLYDTEMLALNIEVNTPTGPLMIRESPTLQSTGKYAIRESPIFPTFDSEFRITSFFDVFTELSLDGGQTWIPADGAGHFDIGPTVPAPGVAGLLALSGAIAARRRRM